MTTMFAPPSYGPPQDRPQGPPVSSAGVTTSQRNTEVRRELLVGRIRTAGHRHHVTVELPRDPLARTDDFASAPATKFCPPTRGGPNRGWLPRLVGARLSVMKSSVAQQGTGLSNAPRRSRRTRALAEALVPILLELSGFYRLREMWWSLSHRLRKRDGKRLPRILFLAPSPVYAFHLAPIAEALTRAKSSRVFAYTPRKSGAQLARFPGQRIGLLRALSSRFEVVVASSAKLTAPYLGKSKLVLVQHGLGGGKVIRGESWLYGDAHATHGGAPIFDLIFVASDLEFQHAGSINQEIRNRLRLCGHPILAEAKRGWLRIPARKKYVLVQSTYGGESLIEAVGPRRLAELCTTMSTALQLPVRVSLHPNYWTGYGGTAVLAPHFAKEISKEVSLINPFSDWESVFHGACAAISDHTSMAVVAAALGIPQLLFRPPKESIDDHSILAHLINQEMPLIVEADWARQVQRRLGMGNDHLSLIRFGLNPPVDDPASCMADGVLRLAGMPQAE